MGLDPVNVVEPEMGSQTYLHSPDHPIVFARPQMGMPHHSPTLYIGPYGAFHTDLEDWSANDSQVEKHITWGNRGRLDRNNNTLLWYDEPEQHYKDAISEALPGVEHRLYDDDYEDSDWHESKVAWTFTDVASELGPQKQVTDIVHHPGKMYGHHSNDTPYIYDTHTGTLFHGDLGAFHSDVEQHPYLKLPLDDKDQYRRGWSKAYGPGMLRGRYTDNQATHYSVPGMGSMEAHALLPYHMGIEKALGVQGDPYFDYGAGVPAYDWDDKTARRSNILDPVHDTLDPRVWDDEGAQAPRLKPHIKKWLQKEIYEQAKHFHPDPEKWLRLVLTGSLTTYQYSNDSDMDVSLFVSPHFLPEWSRGQLIGLMVKNMDGTVVPGTPFPIQCFVVAKNISPADLYQPGLRSGYDIEQDHWLVPPDRTRIHDVEREQNVDWVYALESADKMERLLRYDPERAVTFWHQIHKRRMRDQTAGKGDFSQANIVYKMLANRGLFPSLSEASGEYIA